MQRPMFVCGPQHTPAHWPSTSFHFEACREQVAALARGAILNAEILA